MKFKKIFRYLAILGIVGLFIFSRFYNIQNSLFFYNDLGRDALVLFNWFQTGKPPLLGPQTSALPINQSPFYFYWLMIFYFLLDSNPVYSVVACVSFYLIIFFFGIKFFKKNNFLFKVWLSVWFLISIHPQIIVQNRYVWNPSFTPPLALFSILTFYKDLEMTKRKENFFWPAFSLAAAVAFSYSIVPLFIVFLLYLIFFKREKLFQFLIFFILSFLFFYLPVIIFEFRHNFLLTQSLLIKSGPAQKNIDLLSKFNSLSNFIIGFDNQIINKALFILVFLYTGIRNLLNLFLNKHDKKNFFYFVFFFLVLFTFLIPITVQAHYIFAILISFFIILFLFERPIKFLIIFLLVVFYFLPIIQKTYFKKAPRTYKEMNNCFKEFCKSFNKPIYVSVVSNFHPYHYGPEHRYLLKKNGCQVYNIEEDQNKTNLMLVILDNGEFNKKTKYYELDLFGRYKVLSKKYCQQNFGYVLLKKLK